MREVLDQPSDEEEDLREMTPISSSSSSPQSNQSHFVICAPDALPSAASALKHPPHSQLCFIYSAFMKNVDPVVKILHGPSLGQYFTAQTEELKCSPGQSGLDALRFAIYYTTATSLAPEECLQQLGEEKAVVLNRFRCGTELALARADFINTEDMSTLQALVLYLVSCTFSLFNSLPCITFK
jgi:hypothetical protein